MSFANNDSKIPFEVGKDIPDGPDKVPLDQTLFELDADKYDAFEKMLDDPPPAGSALKALMKRRTLWQK